MNAFLRSNAWNRLAIDVSISCLCFAFASSAGLAQEPFSPRFPNRKAFDRFVEEGRDSPFGLDYVFVHNPGARNVELVESVSAAVGVRWVNLARLEWNVIERRPPKDGRQSHDEPTGEMLARIPIAGTRARITHIITEIGQSMTDAIEPCRARLSSARASLGWPVTIHGSIRPKNRPGQRLAPAETGSEYRAARNRVSVV